MEHRAIEPNHGCANLARERLGLHGVQAAYLHDVQGVRSQDLLTINQVFEHLPDRLLPLAWKGRRAVRFPGRARRAAADD